MNLFNRLTIASRVASGLILAGVLLLALTVISVYQGQASAAAVRTLVDGHFTASSKMQAIDGNVIRIHRAMKDVALAKSPKALDAAAESIPPLEKVIDEDLAAVVKTGMLTTGDTDAVRAALTAWQTFRHQTVAMMRAGKTEEAAERTKAEGAALAKSLIAAVGKGVTTAQAQARAQAETTVSATSTTAWIMIGAFVLAVALTGIFGTLQISSMTGPLSQAVEMAEAVAAGRLSTRTHWPEGHDEFSRLLQALGRMNNNLVDIIQRVRSSSDSIAAGSAQIASGNTDLSNRTEQQASNLQETAASMEELSGTVKSSADTASQANDLAAIASAAAAKGGDMVGQVVSTMQDIAASSKKIADIIGVIDGIAFQTNILALNAAVEAARAGEQGRGFAVVASEVRSLAGRSADAAKEIKELIGASVDKVNAGARLVDSTGASMSEIVGQVQRVSQMINELSSAASEQALGINQVGQAVSHLDRVTQQNAALVEQSAAAAANLKQQAASLAGAVSVFKFS